MNGNFVYHNPTKLYFGPDSLNGLEKELKNYGPNILLNYGGGSIKRNGVYDEVMAVLRKTGKTVVENPGVMSNPTLEKLNEGVDIARNHKVDLILAVGGGSVCDYSKAVAAATHYDGDYWEAFYLKQQNPPEGQVIPPVACVLTMAGTGSEMNAGTVITDAAHTLKVGHVFDERLMPKFSILNPNYTLTVPDNQMKAGIYDIMNHSMEQYFSGDDDNTSDYLSEGLMRGLIVAARKAVKNPKDYEARSNIMWTATWALNGLIACGKPTDWMVHMLGQAVAAYTDATHGHTLSAVSGAYYRLLISRSKDAEKKFCRLAENVWGISSDGKAEKEIAVEGLDRMEDWMRELGLAMNITDCGADDSMLEGMADACPITESGYVVLTREDVIDVLLKSLK